MKILQISDTHNRHSLLSHLPIADVIVHCGDFTEYGTEKEVLLKKKIRYLQMEQLLMTNII